MNIPNNVGTGGQEAVEHCEKRSAMMPSGRKSLRLHPAQEEPRMAQRAVTTYQSDRRR